MELGVGTTVWFEGRPGVVIEGPDEDGWYEVEYTTAEGALETLWSAPTDRRFGPRRR